MSQHIFNSFCLACLQLNPVLKMASTICTAPKPWPWRKKVRIWGHETEELLSTPRNTSCWFHPLAFFSADMHMFGHCPARDDFYLVVCSHCGQVVKPQAFERHCERWHSAITSLFSRSSTLVAEQRLSPDQPPSNVPSCVEKLEDRCVEGSARSSAVLPRHQCWTNNDLEDTVRYYLQLWDTPNGLVCLEYRQL